MSAQSDQDSSCHRGREQKAPYGRDYELASSSKIAVDGCCRNCTDRQTEDDWGCYQSPVARKHAQHPGDDERDQHSREQRLSRQPSGLERPYEHPGRVYDNDQRVNQKAMIAAPAHQAEIVPHARSSIRRFRTGLGAAARDVTIRPRV